jgi:hypothetical protein
MDVPAMSYRAHFGYLNENDYNVIIPVGDKNKFTGGGSDDEHRGQPTEFYPGRTDSYPDAEFYVVFDGTDLVWTLEGPDGEPRTSTASADSERCELPPEPEPEPGAILLHKYACPVGTEFSTENVPDAEGEFEVPEGCVAVEGAMFGYYFKHNEGTSWVGDIMGAEYFSYFGTTDENGMIYVEELSLGQYDLAEFVVEEVMLHDEDMLYFGCMYDHGSKTDNYEYTIVKDDETSVCVAYNVLPEDEPFVCTEEESLINRIMNGDFETPVVVTQQGWDVFPDGTPGMEWQVEWRSDIPASYNSNDKPENGHLELHRGVNGWLPYSGEQYAELDSDWDGPAGSLVNEPASVVIFQHVETAIGQEYSLSYAFSPRPGAGSADNQLRVLINDVEVDLHIADGTENTNTEWTVYSFSFVATEELTKVAFEDAGTANSIGTFIDDVTLNCVMPEEPQDAHILMCKEDQFEERLEGWQLLLHNAEPVATLSVYPDGETYSVEGLEEGNYVVISEGKYVYRSTPGARYTDAAFSLRLETDNMYQVVGPTYENWVRLYGYTQLLSLQVDGVAVDWGMLFSHDHTYAYGHYHMGGDLEFRILDDNYADNSGHLTVYVYEGYSGWTGEEGCFELHNVPLGDYVVSEMNHQQWENIAGLGPVTVEGDETFVVVNRRDVPDEPMTCEEAVAEGLLYGYITGVGTATVVNEHTHGFEVSFASYEMYSENIFDQQLYDYETKMVGGESSEQFEITVPACMYQVDLICGKPVQMNPDYTEEEKLDSEIVLDLPLCQMDPFGDAVIEVADYYPQGAHYVFECHVEGFTPERYDWYFGDGQFNFNRAVFDVYYVYPAEGDYTVTCLAQGEGQHAIATRDITVVFDDDEMSCETALEIGLLRGEITGEGHAVVYNDHSHGFEVSLASYEMYSENVFDQMLYDYETKYVPGMSTEHYQISVPACMYQIDLICGKPVERNPDYTDAEKLDSKIILEGDYCQMEPLGEAWIEIAEGFPQNGDYVFECHVEGFTPERYDWYFGDGEFNFGLDVSDVYYVYENEGDYIVTCAAYGEHDEMAVAVLPIEVVFEEPVCVEEPFQIVIVSDELTMTGEGNAVATYVHPAWTAEIEGATWIWATEFVETPEVEETYTFTRTFHVHGTVESAILDIATDNSYRVYINGEFVGEDLSEKNFQLETQDQHDVTSYIVMGDNTLEVEVTNFGVPGSTPQSNPAGLLYKLSVEGMTVCEDEPVEPEYNVHLYVMDGYPQENHYVFVCENDFEAETFDWDFGDQNFLYDIVNDNVYHIYTKNGEFTVSCGAIKDDVIVYDSITVEVTGLPEAWIVMEHEGKALFSFSCENDFEADTFDWYFGDAGFILETGKHVEHEFSSTGWNYASCYAINSGNAKSAYATTSVLVEELGRPNEYEPEYEPEGEIKLLGQWIWFGPELAEVAQDQETEQISQQSSEMLEIVEEMSVEEESGDIAELSASPLTGRAIATGGLAGLALLLLLGMMASAVHHVNKSRK